MIPKISRGSDPEGLLRYLFAPGRHNEHRDQHLIAGSMDMREGFGLDGRPMRSFRELGDVLDRRYMRQLAKGEPCPPDRHSAKRNPGNRDGLDRVWHCSLAIRAGDGILTDQQWESLVFLVKLVFRFRGGDGIWTP